MIDFITNTAVLIVFVAKLKDTKRRKRKNLRASYQTKIYKKQLKYFLKPFSTIIEINLQKDLLPPYR
ncbi:hypothetical protein [Flavobacterium sp. GNP001]